MLARRALVAKDSASSVSAVLANLKLSKIPETHSAEACQGTGPTERLSGRVGKGMPKSNFPQLLTSNRLADVVTQTGLA